MDNEKDLVHFILQYLLDNHFQSKSDMARQLDIRSRTIQRAFEQLHNDKAKGSTIVLDRALLFCAQRRISVDQVFREYHDYLKTNQQHSAETDCDHDNRPFVEKLCVPEIGDLSEQEQANYEYFEQYLRDLLPYVCPHCHDWCNPWGEAGLAAEGLHHGKAGQCFV